MSRKRERADDSGGGGNSTGCVADSPVSPAAAPATAVADKCSPPHANGIDDGGVGQRSSKKRRRMGGVKPEHRGSLMLLANMKGMVGALFC